MPQLSSGARLRVFMTTDAVGGVWQYAVDLAEGLRPHGAEVTLAVLGPAPTADQREAAQAAGVNLLLTNLPLDWAAHSPHQVKAASRALSDIAAQAEPDVVHLNNPAFAASASFPAPIVAVCHSCVATWWNAVREGELPDEFVWRTDLVGRGYRAAAGLIAPTRSFARSTAVTYGLEEPPVVVRNGRKGTSGAGDASPAPFALTVGRLWDEGKNLAAVDRAAERTSVPILAAGPLQGPNGAGIRLRNIQSLGRLTDAEVAGYLKARPIFVSVARYEPFGLAVLEAAQSGCALILSDIPTFRELWDGAAMFVPPDDEQEIARTIDGLAHDREFRIALGQAAANRACAYTVEAMSAGVMASYRSALASHGTRSSVEEDAA
ncbi:glycosyltransferase family 4 protein [Microvirga subterranea]|uniref:Glycosyltransferase involved in cell wall biosynthesis n=1 Tax=Microvirga subterranea TaxID=186651 RepID=A0A370HQY9_9HYPH|nr:glycosyltransferase family 4 protein [Microvirga subterranea]RDI59324.1 glycosyltransferase involved in cell wall biosynthesis [Microvirga subterranea]